MSLDKLSKEACQRNKLWKTISAGSGTKWVKSCTCPLLEPSRLGRGQILYRASLHHDSGRTVQGVQAPSLAGQVPTADVVEVFPPNHRQSYVVQPWNLPGIDTDTGQGIPKTSRIQQRFTWDTEDAGHRRLPTIAWGLNVLLQPSRAS